MNVFRVLVMTGTMLVFVAMGGISLRAETVSATAFSVSGTVEFAAPHSSTFSSLKAGQVLPVGSTVRTGSDGKAILQATPGSAVEVGSDSILRINALAFTKEDGAVTERKARLQLTSGVVSVLVDPGTPKITDFQVQTPEGAASARGTFYTVVVKDGKTYSTVTEGKSPPSTGRRGTRSDRARFFLCDAHHGLSRIDGLSSWAARC
jgi:hypothetical protein